MQLRTYLPKNHRSGCAIAARSSDLSVMTPNSRGYRHQGFDSRHDRRHPAGTAVSNRRGPPPGAGGEGRVVQSGRLDQGSHRGRTDRCGRARRPSAARRHDRRTDLGEHRHRAGDRSAAQGLPRDRGDARQDVQGEDRPPARLWRGGGAGSDRRRTGLAAVLLPGRRPADRSRSPARSSPTNTRTRRTRAHTTSRPDPSSGSNSATG